MPLLNLTKFSCQHILQGIPPAFIFLHHLKPKEIKWNTFTVILCICWDQHRMKDCMNVCGAMGYTSLFNPTQLDQRRISGACDPKENNPHLFSDASEAGVEHGGGKKKFRYCCRHYIILLLLSYKKLRMNNTSLDSLSTEVHFKNWSFHIIYIKHMLNWFSYFHC